MSNLVDHARSELKFMGMDPDSKDPEKQYDTMIAQAVVELIEVFAKQGHSGFSAPYTIKTFEKLAMFEPLGPITGADEEWSECHDGIFQNKRCSHVFKSKDRFDGQAYDIQGKVFTEIIPDGHRSSFTGSESAVPITFPYVPKTEYVDVIRGDDGEWVVKPPAVEAPNALG